MEEVSSPSKTVKSKRVVFSDLDVVKFLMAFLVVEIHTRPFGISFLVQGIDCIAVPFFFIASAFLCFRGVDVGQFSDGESGACFRVRKTIKKLLMLYVAWTVIYIPVSLFGYALNGLGPTAIFVSFVRGTVFVGENVYSWPLWYLLASAVAFFLVFILLRGGVRPVCILGVAAAFALLGFAMSCVHEWSAAPALLSRVIGLYFKVFANVRNGLFEGFFYVALGMCLGIKWDKAVGVAPMASAAMAAFGALGCVIMSPDAHLPFCASYALGVFLLSIHRYGEGSGGHVLLRNASTGIYLTHMIFVVLFIYGICGSTDPSSTTNSQVPHLATFSFAVTCALATSMIASKSARRFKSIKPIFGF